MEPQPSGLRLSVSVGTIRIVRLGGFAQIVCLLIFVAGPVLIVTAGIRAPTETIGLLVFAFGLWSTQAYVGAFGNRRAKAPALVAIIGLVAYTVASS